MQSKQHSLTKAGQMLIYALIDVDYQSVLLKLKAKQWKL